MHPEGMKRDPYRRTSNFHVISLDNGYALIEQLQNHVKHILEVIRCDGMYLKCLHVLLVFISGKKKLKVCNYYMGRLLGSSEQTDF